MFKRPARDLAGVAFGESNADQVDSATSTGVPTDNHSYNPQRVGPVETPPSSQTVDTLCRDAQVPSRLTTARK
jgi:hypothetical protein